MAVSSSIGDAAMDEAITTTLFPYKVILGTKGGSGAWTNPKLTERPNNFLGLNS